MRITSKGQVTIPQEIREKAGLLPHSEVEFEPATARRPGSGRGTRRMTTDEIMALTRR